MAAKKKKGGFDWSGGGGPCTTPGKEPPKTSTKTEVEKVKAAGIKEDRIEFISAIMRLVCTSDGKRTWTRKAAQKLAAEWGMTLQQVYALSGEAHKRVKSEVNDPEAIRRDTGSAWYIGLCKAIADNKLSDLAKFVALGDQLTKGPVQVEVSVKAKEPTAADAAQAILDMFPKKIKSEDAEPADSIGDAGGTPKK